MGAPSRSWDRTSQAGSEHNQLLPVSCEPEKLGQDSGKGDRRRGERRQRRAGERVPGTDVAHDSLASPAEGHALEEGPDISAKLTTTVPETKCHMQSHKPARTQERYHGHAMNSSCSCSSAAYRLTDTVRGSFFYSLLE